MVSPTRSTLSTCLPVFFVAAMAQLALALNPGWFSHDELQWGAIADVASLRELPWMDWTDLGQFQWRPLTFNLWLFLSHALFYSPMAWHLLWVLLGSAIAAAFAALLLRLDVPARIARPAALVGGLGPCAVYVHGWVATLADLLWIALALGLAHVLVSLRGARGEGAPKAATTLAATASAALAGAVFTAVALMAKEAALSIAALLVLCWLLWPRERVLAGASAGALAVALAYLAVRMPVLLHGGSGSAYAIAPALAPRNWLAYHLYLLRPSTFEVAGLWRAPVSALVLMSLAWLALWVGVARANGRLAFAMVVGGALALAPALPIAMTANQYAYAFSLWSVACVALAWTRMRRVARVLAWLMVLVTLWHGANVQREMRAAGERQALFQPALVAALATHAGELRLYAPERPWLYRRLTTQVGSWHRHPIGERVRWVDSAAQADLVVAPNGQLLPP